MTKQDEPVISDSREKSRQGQDIPLALKGTPP